MTSTELFVTLSLGAVLFIALATIVWRINKNIVEPMKK